jgi:hypothetical protein
VVPLPPNSNTGENIVRELLKTLYANEKISVTDITRLEKVISTVYERCLEHNTQPVLYDFIQGK